MSYVSCFAFLVSNCMRHMRRDRQRHCRTHVRILLSGRNATDGPPERSDCYFFLCEDNTAKSVPCVLMVT